MPKSKIKNEFKDEHVAFGKGGHGLKLGQREDIDKLAIIALKSGNRHLLRYFEQPMPTIEDLEKDETDAQLKKAPAPATNQAPTAPPAMPQQPK